MSVRTHWAGLAALLVGAGAIVGCGGGPTGDRSCATTGDCDAQICVAHVCVDPPDALCHTAKDCGNAPRCQTSLACDAGHCVYGGAAAGTPCDDGNGCTDQDVCDGMGVCISASNICLCTVADDCPAAPGSPACHAIVCPAGSCVYTPLPDASCGGAVCVGATTYLEQRCDVSGTCAPSGGTPCPGRFKCDAGGQACKASCAGAQDCLAGLRCTNGTCADPPCGSAAQCTVPPGNPACYSAACTGGDCQYAVMNNAACGGATCVVATLYAEQRCNALGNCAPTSGTTCAGGFRCNALGTACRASCVGNQDCQANLVCNAASGCEDPAGDGSDGNVTLATAVDLNAQSAGADSDDNAAAPDGVAYRVASNPTTTAIDVGTTPTGFVAGDKALLIDLQGTSADAADVGNYEIVDVTGTNGTTVTLATAPTKSYDGTSFASQRVYLQRMPQYDAVTIGAGGTLSAGAYNGSSATGIVAFFAHTLTIQAGGKIDVGLRGHVGGSGAGTCPDTPAGPWCLNGDVGKPGGVGAVNGAESNGGNGGNGGGAASVVLGKGGNGSASSQYASVTGVPGAGGTGYQGGGGGGARNDNTPGFQDGAGGGGKPYTYGAAADVLRTDATCAKISLSAGAPPGAQGGANGTQSTPGGGGGILGGTPGGRGAGVVLVFAGTLTTSGADQIGANGGDGGAGTNGGDGVSGSRNCGGGGGGGAQGAGGGSICLRARTFAVGAGALAARGGKGGDGGKGGNADPAVCGTGTAAGPGAPFVVGNDVGGAGATGAMCGAGSGGGGGGGNAGFAGRVSMTAL